MKILVREEQPLNGNELKQLRQQAGINGYLVCQRSGVGRSRLSDIERGYVDPSQSEVQRIQTAIEELLQARQKVVQLAEQVGWPL